MKELSEKDKLVIRMTLAAFLENFEPIKIMKGKRWYYVYKSEADVETEQWIYCTNSIHNLNGWLYGAVQSANNIIRERGN